MRCYDACDMIWVEFFSQTLASYVMLRVHRVEVIFWWFKVLGNLQGAHCEYQKALDGNKSDSYAHKAVDGPRKFMAWTARTPPFFGTREPAPHVYPLRRRLLAARGQGPAQARQEGEAA